MYLKDISDNDISQSDNAIEVQFHKKEPKMLEVLSLQLAGAVLPFVHYFQPTLKDKDFENFVKYATTNSNIFYDFARYISKNYIFYVSPTDAKSKKNPKNKRYTKREFARLLDEIYSNIFEPKVIRKRFLEFVNKHLARALSEAPMKLGSSKISEKYDTSDFQVFGGSVSEMKKQKINQLKDQTSYRDNLNAYTHQELGRQPSNKYAYDSGEHPQPWDLSIATDQWRNRQYKGGSKRYREDYDNQGMAHNPLKTESFSEFEERQATKYRMDDTINIVRNPNLSVEWEHYPRAEEDAEFELELRENYGSKLLE